MISYAEKLRAIRAAAAQVEAPTSIPASGLKPALLELLARTLGVPEDRLSATAPLAEQGVNSLLGVRFLDAVNRAYDLRLGAEVLFAHGSVSALAEHLAGLVRVAAEPAALRAPLATPGAGDDIAVIGMAGRFPGAADLAEFWALLAEGRCALREVPPERWDAATFYSADPTAKGKTISRWAGLLDGIDRFDAAFFGISPREAAAMDPQHRLFLEQAWLAFEDAGYAESRLRGTATGVFVGASGSGYETMLDPEARATQSYGLTGNLVSLIASRIAYYLDLRGPALVVDTACSASLVALDLACQALRRGDIGMALVGGASLFLDEKPFVAMTRTGMLSPDGRCHTFDAAANGIAVGEAVVAVVLKPLARARADADRIDAVIKASGTNQDGRSNGITAPNPEAQAALLRAVHARAGIDPATITYVEAHGTGTPLGDPVEVSALRMALGTRAPEAVPCGIGAVKSNICHTAEAAGLAGLVKVVLCLRHGELVPSVNFSSLNPKIDVGSSGLTVVTRRQAWRPAEGAPRRAGVSAFGLSGTNAHVVLEEAPAALPSRHVAEPTLLLLSARDAEALARRVADLASWLRGAGRDAVLQDVAATLALGRSHFDHRLALVATTTAEAARHLTAGAFRSGTVGRTAAPDAILPTGLDQAAALYIQGAAPAWPALWANNRHAVSLPGYPFAPAIHWAARRPVVAMEVVTHPFADAGVERVAHRFTPADAVVRDHAIDGIHVLHAAVFLEMARLAAARAAGQPVSGLRDIVWEQTVPVPANGIALCIDTVETANGIVCAMTAGDAVKPAARGRAVFEPGKAGSRIEIAALKASADRHADRQMLDGLDRGAVRLGPSFAGFDELWLGAQAALAWVGPIGVEDGCLLPPRLTDAAIQTAATLLARADGPALRLRYPAGVAAIDIVAPAPRMGCFIEARAAADDRVDLIMADADGAPCMCWAGFEMREAASPRPRAVADSMDARAFAPLWIEVDVPKAVGPALPAAVVGDAAWAARIAGGTRALALAANINLERILFLDSGAGDTGALLRLVKELADRGLGGSSLELRAITAPAQRVTGREAAVWPQAAAVQGLAKAIGREFPSWRVVILDVEDAEIGPDLLTVAASGRGEVVAIRAGVRFERVLEPVEARPAATTLRPRGAYLLVGGMGRVGREVARHLAAEYGARLVLVGRAPLDAKRAAFLETLRASGAEADYEAADITAPGALTPVIDRMKARFDAVHGVVQAVVDPLFARLERTEPAAFAAALAPKIAGLREVARATEGEPLDFLAVFSSIGAYAGFPGNIGQASYCAACCFEEAFAADLRAAGRPVRLIQWGLWENEAFVGDGLARLRRQGTYPMQAAEAVIAFGQILSDPAAHVVQASLSDAVWQAMGASAPPPAAFRAASAALQSFGQDAEPLDATLHHAVDAYARTLAGRRLRDHGPLSALPRHARLFAAVQDLLQRDEGAAPARDSLLARAPSLREPLELLELCVAALPDVITGEREGTDVLFPGGSMHLVEAIYRNQPVLAACNAMLAAAAAAGRPGRILEVGAGTGATTAAVLAALGPAAFEYHCTDVSAGFVHHARTRFPDPRLRFTVLDIERDPAGQGFDAGGFDLILATNVLHATRDMGETLRHLAGLLRPGGLTLINEMTVAEDFATLTFGLLDGWWRAADPARRLPHSPLLDVPRWRQALRSAGFAAITAVPAPGFADAATSPQTVLLAAKAGAPVVTAPGAKAGTTHPAVATTTVGIERFIQEKVAIGLDMAADAIAPDTPFGEMGVDSIVAPQIAEDINRAGGITLRSTDLYNFSTVRSLAAHLAANFPNGNFGEPVLAPAAAPVNPAAIVPAAETDNAIAIIGMAGRFPDAPDLETFWENIAAGRSAVREIDRFDLTPFLAAGPGEAGKTYAKWAAVLDDYDRFDPLFFAISPAEAEAMDPQQRLLLEEAWHALEDAGATPAQLDGARCGVFVGASANSYVAPASPALQTLGGSMAILSARLSYFLNLKGPTFPVDTGCSSSLVALHLACQSLRTGESDMAIAAGVSCNLLSPPIFLYLADAGMASPHGRCATFDDDADGFAPGEGVGVVVLKRLADALRDGDRVHAVVRGTGINQDGKTSGLTAPSATSQTALEHAVYIEAGVNPETIGLVEAHGTGTRLGDPIEVAALSDAFAAFTPHRGFCAIGSVKTNIGHAMAAAGIAGLLKTVQAIRHHTLPATLNFSTPNRHIDFANSPFVVNTETREWVSAHPRRAVVSSFGFSGTNAHVVVEEAPLSVRNALPEAGPVLIALSAKTDEALARRLEGLRQWLRRMPDVAMADLAYTLGARRAHFRQRRAFIVTSREDLLAALDGRDVPEAPAALGALAKRYEAGEAVDCDFMHGRIIDLPGYPFERDRFWNPEVPTASVQPQAPRPRMSRLATGWLVREHVIQGRRLLPGAAFLELARAGVCGADAGCTIRDVVWSAPVDATEGEPGVALRQEPIGRETRCTLAAGQVVHATALVSAQAPDRPASLDLAAVAARCPRILDGAAIYDAAAEHGFAYGPAYRVITAVSVGRGEALAQLSPPQEDGEGWVLHPALLDGAFQTAACIGLGEADGAYVPFALSRFTVYAPLRGACRVHARRVSASGGLLAFDITICAEDGAVLAASQGLQARMLTAPPVLETVFFTPEWQARPLALSSQPPGGRVLALVTDSHAAGLRSALPDAEIIRVAPGDDFARRPDGGFTIDPTQPDHYARLLAEAGPATNLLHLWALDTDPAASASLAGALAALDPDIGVRSCFLAAQAVLRAPDPGIGRMVFGAPPGPTAAAHAALARTVMLESSRLTCVAIALTSGDLPMLAAELASAPEAAEIAYRDGERFARGLEPWVPEGLPAPAYDGVIVITGGAGAIGLSIARHLARKGQPRLVLLGRSALATGQQAALAEIEAAGSDVLYLSTDVTSGSALRAALDKARRRFGPITGVIHAAGVLRDGRMVQQTPEAMDAVLAPKLLGAITLDHLTREDPLSFFLLCSSTAATFGSAGQAGYAAANGFLEGFAEWRTAQGRPGRTTAIGWPLWRSAGMTPPADVAAELDRRMGMVAMPEAAALAVLDHVLMSAPPCLTVLHGRPGTLRAFVGQAPATHAVSTVPAPSSLLREDVEAYLKSVIAEVTKLAPERIESTVRFEEYGIDSMMIVRMNTRLEQEMGELPKTLFFEYQTVRDLARCLMDGHAAALAGRFGQTTAAQNDAPAPLVRPVAVPDGSAIAIIGIAGIYPMAADLDQFWRNLADGRDCIVEIPAERWSLEGFYDPNRERPETSYSKWGGFIDGVDHFDARFFNISPREADALDPQARKFLEIAWATMEDAGLTRETLFARDEAPAARLGGVFVGVMYGDYQLFGPEEAARGHLIAPNAAYWNVANRVSHFLDLHGPSMAVDTACSSSLTAIHTACAALRNGDCTVAFAGGVNLTVHPSKHWVLSKSGFASSDGRCRSFGEGGDGYVPGEGIGAVLLKPLARAMADGNRVHAIIRASAVNHGGRTNGYTVPNPVAQGALVSAALKRGGIAPGTISYIEAHGTGTSLGDPVEIAGLARAFGGLPAGSVPLGSVKSNIGHLESAAGIAALTKVVLQFRHGSIAPSLHAARLNPNLALGTTPFVVQQRLADWPRRRGERRRAGISSFGAGGANAHLIVEEAPEVQADAPWTGGALILPFSAATPEALAEQATRLADWLEEQGETVDLAGVARTLQVGREAMRHRLAIRAAVAEDAIRQLRAFVAGRWSAPEDSVAMAWVAGGTVDWDAEAPGPRRTVSLPSYPFARRRCWVELTARVAGAVVPVPGIPMPIDCPMDSPLVADHRFRGETVLGGAYLIEAARKAGQAIRGTAVTALADIHFLRPVMPAMAPAVAVDADGSFAVRVGEATHATGRLMSEAKTAIPALDLDAIERRCPQPIAHEAIYDALASGGAEYGPAYQRLDRVWRGDGEVLAELALPDAVIGWPPNLLDAVFQMTFALTQDKGGLAPFTIDRIAVTGPLRAASHAYGVRRETGPGFVRLDLRLTDPDGAVLMAIDGFVARTAAPAAVSADLPLRLLRPVWSAAPRPTGRPAGRALILGERARGMALRDVWPDGVAQYAEMLSATCDSEEVWYCAEDAEGDEATAVVRLADLVKGLATLPQAPRLTVVTSGANSVLPGEAPNPAAAAVAAFAKSVGREHPDFRLRVIDAEAATPAATLLTVGYEDGEIAWRGRALWRKHLIETGLDPQTAPWREGGTYLIAGGAGGIGLALAAHLVQVASARVAILGRRPLDETLAHQIARVGGEVAYLQADVTDAEALAEAVRVAEARFGTINGAFHLALTMQDARAVKLSHDDIRKVLAPKATGTRNLMAALQNCPLDFLMLFSSANAHTTNPGQSAYAAASAAQDAIGLLPAPWPVKIADWGFWGEVGRVATPEYRASLTRIGVYPIGTAEGFATVEAILGSPHRQIMPLRITQAVATALGIQASGLAEAAAEAVGARAAAGADMLAEAMASFTAIDAYAASLALLALQDRGTMQTPGETVGEDFAARFGIQPRFRRLFAAILDILGRAGFLHQEFGTWRVTARAAEPEVTRRAALDRQRAGWIAREPEVAPYLDLLDACARRLADVLRGELDANDVLFPGGSAALVEPIYRGNKVVDHFQSIVAAAAAAAVRQRLESLPPGETLRILEIGGGTGGTTAFVLPLLAPYADRISFTFTDVGRGFLDAARTRFAAYPFLAIEHLDIEQSPMAQGFAANSFDIVIAANVLHATRNIGTTLAHVRGLCRPGALLLLNEATARQDFNTLTFGLTRGWWLFEDAEARIAHAPLLDVLAWQAALAQHGFRSIQVLAGGAGALQSVIAADGDGASLTAVPPKPAPATLPVMAGGQARIEAVLREAVAKSLRLSPEEVEPETSFADYGADSIISVELVRDINAALGIDLKTTALFNYSTIRTLAGYIGTEFAAHFGKPVEEAPKPASQARARTERLRDMIRRSRDGRGIARAPTDPSPTRSPASPAVLDDDAALLSLLKRLQAGDIDVTRALAETQYD